jgi:undecaprenyl-diphosphatase
MRTPSTAPSSAPLRRRELCLLSLPFLALLALLAGRVHHGSWPLTVDQLGTRLADIRWPHRLARPGLPRLSAPPLVYLVAYALPLTALAAVLAMAAVAWRRGDRWAALLAVVGPIVVLTLTEAVAKPLVDRRRGGVLAFPSGHAAGAAAVAAVLIVLLNRWNGRGRLLRWIPVAAALPAGMGISIVRLGWHYPTDVVGGVALGLSVILVLAAALPRPPPTPAA